MFAAVKFICEKDFNIVPVEDIKRFEIKDEYPDPYLIKKFNSINGEEEYEPGHILAVSKDKDELHHNKKRYVFKKMRRSDALQMLAQQPLSPVHDSDSDNDFRVEKFENADKIEKQSKEKDSQMQSSLKKDCKTKKKKKEINKDLQRKIAENEKVINQDILQTKFGIALQFDDNENAQDIPEGQCLMETDQKIKKLEEEINDLKILLEKRNQKLTKKNEKIKKLKTKCNELQEIVNQYQLINSDKTEGNNNDNSEKTGDNTPCNLDEMQENFIVSPVHEYETGKLCPKDMNVVTNEDVLRITSTPTSHEKLGTKSSRAQKRLIADVDKENNEVEFDFSESPFNEECNKKRKYKKVCIQDDSSEENDSQESQSSSQMMQNNNSSNYSSQESQSPSQMMQNSKSSNHSNSTSDDNVHDEDYIPQTEFQKFKVKIGNKEVRRYHLCNGIVISYSQWVEARDKETASQFVRTLAEAIWGEHALKNRALDATKVQRQLSGRSPVKACTPRKLDVLEKSYIRYLAMKNILTAETKKTMSSKDHKELLKKWRCYLKFKINSLRSHKSHSCKPGVDEGTSSSMEKEM